MGENLTQGKYVNGKAADLDCLAALRTVGHPALWFSHERYGILTRTAPISCALQKSSLSHYLHASTIGSLTDIFRTSQGGAYVPDDATTFQLAVHGA